MIRHSPLLSLAVIGLLNTVALTPALAADPVPMPSTPSEAPSFKGYDSNNDGKVTLKEFQAKGGDEQTFRLGDANKDNALSSEEFLALTR